MTPEPHVKNPAAVALGRLNAGRPRRQSPELVAKRRQLMANARAVLAAKRAQGRQVTAEEKEVIALMAAVDNPPPAPELSPEQLARLKAKVASTFPKP